MRNAAHIGKSTQNDLFQCCKDEISYQIAPKVQNSVFYSIFIMFDEVIDLSNKSQLTLVLGFVTGLTIYEQFVGLMNEEIVQRTEEKNQKHAVIEKMKELNLDLKNCIRI